jgi:hypothetical protein
MKTQRKKGKQKKERGSKKRGMSVGLSEKKNLGRDRPTTLYKGRSQHKAPMSSVTLQTPYNGSWSVVGVVEFK